jgi:YggT family protein
VISALPVATIREDVAGYIETLGFVYTLLIIAYILQSLYFNFGGRLPYARWSSAVIDFLRQVVEPYLAVFRRFIPPLGPLDLSPIIAIIVVRIVSSILAAVIRG